ncbi:MAG: TRAM domain-containing protein, partial [Pseudomonadales bacterium]|nr:TRAM domain-containing protein [Pseudomonadales bacterium]
EKRRRLKHMDTLQERILTEKNNSLIGDRVQILVEGRKRGKLHGRTRTDKLVYVEESNASIGSIQYVLIDKSSPWSLQGSQLGSTLKAEL